MVQAHTPEHVVPGGLPTERLIAWIIVSKFGNHLPFYRQAGIPHCPGASDMIMEKFDFCLFSGTAPGSKCSAEASKKEQNSRGLQKIHQIASVMRSGDYRP